MGAPRNMSWRARCVAVAFTVPVFLEASPARAAPARPAPGDLWAAQTGPNVVTLVWNRPERASRFRIFESEGGTFKQISSPRSSADSFTFTVRPPWGVRKYAIDAVFEDGSVSVRALFNEIRVEEAKPGPVPAPASVSAEQTGAGEVTIRWSEVPNASAFVIGRAVGTGGLQTLCRICPTTGRYVDRTPQAGAKHTYSVMALAAGGASRRAMSNVLVPTGTPAMKPATARGAAARARAVSPEQDEDPNGPRADVSGKVVEPTSRMNFPGVPAAYHPGMKEQAERLWSVFVRNPALNPPIGFDIKPSFVANGLSPRRGEPFVANVGGYIHWYTFVPSLQRVERIAVADHAIYVVSNLLNMVFSDKWQEDSDGVMYYEPREIRRVAGYPQYKRGVIAVTDSPRPLWAPVPLERVLRSELAVARTNLEGLRSSEEFAATYDPAANLEAWLRDRPKRQRENDRMVQEEKKSDPKLAEQTQRIFEMSEQQTEKVLREIAAHPERSALPRDVLARNRAQRQQAEQCIATLEKELTELSPAERTAPAYVAWSSGPKPLPKAGCSMTVDATFPDAIRIVEPNREFFDTTRPRTEAQVIFVDFSSLHGDSSQQTGRFRRAYDRLREGMDYKAFAAMTARR